MQTIFETNLQENEYNPELAMKNLISKFDKTNALFIATTVQLLFFQLHSMPLFLPIKERPKWLPLQKIWM